ncbi:phosphonate ABC transporter ATP-binding protein [Paenibacillus mucilaginosus]|uniref:Phosphonate ABC transporter ATP-binding protein n=3 Tax=Paenibacillus mucilaginosus TaxID=61624 RepID=H6NJN8_9BACL|nr:phosphonate ABC transporter ATP-binding protein [Paenibacillus mucilaginosus]AEI41156.1 phosphonate ABC transporter ATP-binding protein [Paenibacillus mucilaginosus KNP414]AFC29718.1 phosphonate ABC transporter ATP-binding protein [Paenibacillus mucilaginosus 3016]AFH61902.1 phosphonate ABC transporter ATP-binding protein [Paenibacillus mucilaginosus K02]MCG7211414.1 phosphonate ABC transporter ATP-binding protein [Paenibacillus mucilaginosus]WDM30208.1 phosphonate ABC transporter ATP-bindi
MNGKRTPAENRGGAPAHAGLEIRGLTKQYPGAKEAALQDVTLTVRPGEWVAVLGRSGAGKSSLIRCINRLIEPDSGEIRWAGQPVTGVSGSELRRLRGDIGMIFQHYNLLPRLSVLTNVIAGRFADIPLRQSLLGVFSGAYKAQAMEALRSVGLAHLAGRKVEALSGGQRQRVAIARVLMQDPQLLLGDEPVSSLDPVTAVRVLDFIGTLHRRGMTVVTNLHDVHAARRYATRIIGLAHGGIVFDGPPEELGEAELQRIYPPDDDKLQP